MRSFLLLITIFFGLSSCGLFITKEDCSGSGLYQLGVNDGANGLTTDRFTRVNKVCQKRGVTPDPQLWLKGRAVGLRRYCTPSNAYRVGETGLRLNNVCTPKAQAAMAEPYLDGKRVFHIKQRIDSAESDLADIDERLVEVDPSRYPSQYRTLVRRQLELERRIRKLERELILNDRSDRY